MRRASFMFLIVMLSCEMVVDLDVPFDGPALTLNSVISADSLCSVRLSLNRYVLDDSTMIFVDDADVTIEEEGKAPVSLAAQNRGLYSAELRPEAGKTYIVKAVTKTHGVVQAATLVPRASKIQDVKIREDLINNQWHTGVSVTFEDDPSSENFYHFMVITKNEYFDFNTKRVRIVENVLYLESDDPAIQNENDGIGFNPNQGVLFKDTFLEGPGSTVSFSGVSGSILRAASYKIILSTLNSDYYKYKSTRSLQQEFSGDPLAQPVNVHDNIENGYGIFGAQSFSISQNVKPGMEISYFSVAGASRGDQITIYGSNFPTNETEPFYVTFHSEGRLQSAEILERSGEAVTVIIPSDAVTGKVVIFQGGRVAVSRPDFQVLN